MNRYPSRAFRRWCAGLVLLVFTWSLPASVEARVSPIELVKFQLKKPNFVIVVESAESMQGMPGENPARYNEVGADCENEFVGQSNRFCRLYAQHGRCEFSGMGKQGYVFDEVPVYSGTSTSTNTRSGGTKVITQTDTGSTTKFTTAVVTSTGANTGGETISRTTTATTTSIGTQTAFQTATSTNSETYYQTATLSAVQTSNATGTITGTETYNTTTTKTGTETYNTTTTKTGTETYYPVITIAYDNLTKATVGNPNYSWTFDHSLGAGTNRVVIVFAAARGSVSSSAIAHKNVAYNGIPATPLPTVPYDDSYGNYSHLSAWFVPVGDSVSTGNHPVTGTSGNNGGWLNGWMTAISFSGVKQSTPTTPTPAWDKRYNSSTVMKNSLTVGPMGASGHWLVDGMFIGGSLGGTWTLGSSQHLLDYHGVTTGQYLGHSASNASANGPLSGSTNDSWTLSQKWQEGAALIAIDLDPAPSTTTATHTVTTTNTGTTTNVGNRTVSTTNTETTTNIGNRTATTTNTGTNTNIETRSVTSTNTATTTNTLSRVSTSTSSGSTTNTTSVTAIQTATAVATVSEVGGFVTVSGTDLTTNTESTTQTLIKTATATTTYIVQPTPDTDNCDSNSCTGSSYCYLQSNKTCASNSECTTQGDFCRLIKAGDTAGHQRNDFCVSTTPTKTCRYQAKSCSDHTTCGGAAGATGPDYCVSGIPARMCSKTGVWCSDYDTSCDLITGDTCVAATSRMMMVKNAVRRVILEHSYDDAVVKLGTMHTYQANLQGSTDNLFPYVKLAEPTFDRTETRLLTRAELLRGTYNSLPCFVEATGPTGTCTIDYSGGGATTTPSVTYTLVTSGSNSRYAIPTGDGKTFTHVDETWAVRGDTCHSSNTTPICRGQYEGSYYTFTHRSGIPIDAGGDPNSPVLGSVKNPQYYSSYKGKSFGSSNNYWMLMDAERSDIANENMYGAIDYTGATWSSSATYPIPLTGATGDPLSTTVACSSSNGAQWDYNVVPMVNATTLGSHTLTPPQKGLLNAARLEKTSFGGFHAVGSIEPVGCMLKNDTADNSHSSVSAYMTAAKGADGSACWQNHVLLVVDGLPRGPGEVAVGGIDCSATACTYDPASSDKYLSACNCPTVVKARRLAEDSKVNVHVIAASSNLSTMNTYAWSTLNNIAIAGSTNPSFINQPRLAGSEDELYFWLNYEMKEALRVRVATTPASAASSTQSGSEITAGGKLYQTVADLPEWRGSLIAYSIETVASTSTATSTGTSTSTDVTYRTTPTWDAARINGWVPCATGSFSCSVPNDTRWKEDRKVFFSDKSGNVHKIAVDATTGIVDGTILNILFGMGMGGDQGETQRIVGWMLGQLDFTTAAPPQTPRPLNPAVMGSVTNSMPIAVGSPGMSDVPGGNHFFYTHGSRTPLVYVGADDGMLHAFDANGGTEVFAFIPADMIPVITKLYTQGGQRYNPAEHIYGLSGSPKVKNLCVENCTPANPTACSDLLNGTWNDSTCPKWKTILIMPEGQGGSHPFALDITDPIVSGNVNLTSDSLLWHAGYKNTNHLSGLTGDTISVPAFAYRKTDDRLDQRVLIASSYPGKLFDAKLTDASTPSVGSGWDMPAGGGCDPDQTLGMVADVALARDYSKDSQKHDHSLIAAYLADTHGRVHQYAPFFTSQQEPVMKLGCNHPLHFSPAVVQLNRNDDTNKGDVSTNNTTVYLAQVTNSLLDSVTRGTNYLPSMLVIEKLTSIGSDPPAADAAFGTNGLIELKAGTDCTGTNCLCGNKAIVTDTVPTPGCGEGGSLLPNNARPTGTPVAVIRYDRRGFELFTTWYAPPASNWDNCPTSDTNGTSYITVHEFLDTGMWTQIAGVPVTHQYVTGVQFVGTTLFVTYGTNDTPPGPPDGLANLGQTFISVDQSLKSLAGERFIRTAWTERLDQ